MINNWLLMRTFIIFFVTFFMNVQVTNATTFLDVIRQYEAVISDFNPDDVKPNYEIEGLIHFDKAELLDETDEVIEQLINDKQSTESIERMRTQKIDTEQNTEYVQRKSFTNDAYDFNIAIQKYDVDRGNDAILSFIASRSEDEYRQFSRSDFNKCKLEFDGLVQLFDKPNAVRDLADSNSSIPKYYTKSNSLEAQWVLGSKVYSYSCVEFVSSQYFFESENISKVDADLNLKDAQSALNFFGFNAGTPDGKLGNKTKNAIDKFQDCVGAWKTGKLETVQYNFLMKTYDASKTRITSSTCEQLQEYVPRRLGLAISNFSISNPKRSSKVEPIVWLNCLESSRRTQLFQFGSDKTAQTNSLVSLGVDFKSGEIYSGATKNIITDNTTISDGVIEWNFTKKSEGTDFDRIETKQTIDRITGKAIQTSDFFTGKKLVARVTVQSECSKVDLETQKF